MSQTLKESLTEYNSQYLAHILKMTQYHQLRCKMTNFKIHSQVHICLHGKPLKVQHNKAQRMWFNCSFLCTPPEVRSIFEVKDTMTKMKSFKGLRLKCLHCAEMLYINKTFYVNKEQERIHIFSMTPPQKKENLYSCPFLSGHLRWLHLKCQLIFI